MEKNKTLTIGIFGQLEQAKQAQQVILAMTEDIKNWPNEQDLKLVGLDCYEFCLPPEGRDFLQGFFRQVDQELRDLYDVRLILPKEKDKNKVGYLAGHIKQVGRAYQHVQDVLQELKVGASDIKIEGLKRIEAGRYQFAVIAQKKGLVVGQKGQNLRKIEKNNNVRIMMHERTEGYITIKGHLDDVQDACRDIKDIIDPTLKRTGRDLPQQELLPGLIKMEDHLYKTVLNRQERAMVIGKRGLTIKKLTTKHKVYFHGPKRDENTDDCMIRGNEDGVVAFFNEVQEIIKNEADERTHDGGQRRQPRPLALGDFF
ncbi:vigilin-like [Macrobrachium rosenbergii]|uniref:vigilin-like n=1 Tax=Macrobrachium rosenbergii TaxID=79674 RepID=UPI0034D6A9FA